MAIKVCKVYPRNDLQFISGILTKRERIELPAELPLNEHEIRRCLSYANVYEKVSDNKDVLLTMQNYLLDNTDAPAATDVPETELKKYRQEEVKPEPPTPDNTPNPAVLRSAAVPEPKKVEVQEKTVTETAEKSQQTQQNTNQKNQKK